MEVRAGYKQTVVGVIPEDWAVEDIAACAESASGITPARAAAERYFHGGTIPWVKTLDLNNSVIKETDECVTETALRETSLKLYPAGSVLVAMYGGFSQIGRTGYLPFPATINQALTAICPNDRKLDSKYLIYFLNHHVGYWKSVASSSRKDPNITGNDVRKFPISLPPTKEQRAIATALSDVDALLDGLTRLIAKKRDLKQATMQQLLTGQTRLPGFSGGWQRADLRNLVQTPITDGPHMTPMFYDTGVPFLSVNNLVNNCIDLRDLRYISKEDDQVFAKKCKPRKGDVLLGKAASVGKVAIVENDFDFNIWSPIALVRAACERINPKFLYYQLLSTDAARQIALLTNSSSQGNIGMGDIERLQISFPDAEEQTAIATLLSDMDAELAALEARLTKTHALKQAMMSELLTGKTRLPI